MSVEINVIKLGSQIPSGWRMMTLAEGKKYKSSLSKFIEEWSIIGFETGKLDGPGYGGNFSDTRGPECGEVAIIKDVKNQKPERVQKASLLKQSTLQKQPTLKQAQEEPVVQSQEPVVQSQEPETQTADITEKPTKPIKAKKQYNNIKKKQVKTYAVSKGSYSGPIKGKQLTYQYEEIFKIYNKQAVPGPGAYEIQSQSNRNQGTKFSSSSRRLGEGFLA